MTDGYSHTDLLEEPPPRACREKASALAGEGRTVAEVADTLGISPLTAWWLSGFQAVTS